MFENERIMAVIFAFEAKPSQSRLGFNEQTWVFEYNKPLTTRVGTKNTPKFEIYPVRLFRYPVYIADPNKAILLNKEPIFKDME